MKVLVLGVGGMLGHKVYQVLSGRFPDTWGAMREELADPAWAGLGLFSRERVHEHVDVADFPSFDAFLAGLRPDVVVNCVGIIKQRREATDPVPSIVVNALHPHRLAALLARWQGRLVHVSTDCVFSGSRGAYREDDAADATDLYGRSKLLGEVVDRDNAVTLRTSIIGRELKDHASLLDWFLAQEHGTVHGYSRHWWSGVTTNHLARLIGDVVAAHPALCGLYHVSSGRISKHDLLVRLRDALRLDVEIVPDDGPVLDRSLDGARFSAATGYRWPGWDAVLDELRLDRTPYRPVMGRS